MTKLNSTQHTEISERFAELIADGMDWKCMYQYVIDDLTQYYEKCDEHELKEQIDDYDDELWDEMVDDVTNETVLDINNTGGKY